MTKDTQPSNPGNTQPTSFSHLWVRILAWTAAGIVSLLLLLVIAASILLNSQRFHDYLLSKVQSEATDALGVRVQVQNYALHLATLSLDIDGVTIDGAQPYANPPLLQLDHASASVRVVSILHGKWYLDSIQIDRPIARIFVDANGVSNIPTIKSSGNSSGNTSIFDLAIRHAILDKGEVYYNNKQTVLDADIHDVDFQASYNPFIQMYSGRLAYSDGHLVSGSLKPIPHNLDARFQATPTAFQITQAKLTSGASQLLLSASLQDYSHPNVQAHYDAIVDGKQMQEILAAASIPTGQVHAAGDIHYLQLQGHTPLDSLTVKGQLNSTRLDLRTPSLKAAIDNLTANYALANGDAILNNLHANLLGGTVNASGTMTHIAGDSHSDFKAQLNSISLAALKRIAGSSPASQQVGIDGKVNAQANATWGKTLDDLVAHADVTAQGNVKGNQPLTSEASAASLPLASVIHATYTAANKQIAFDKSYLQTPKTNITLNGVVSGHSSLDLHLQADDLRELESVADLFRTPTPGQPLTPLGLEGTASFQGTVRGSTAAPHLTGQLLASNFKFNGSAWKVLRTDVDLSPSLASLQHADLEPASRGQIKFNASVALNKWSYSNTSAIQVDLDASQLNIAELTKLAGQTVPVTGTLNASLKLHGTQLNPGGNGNLSLVGLTAYDQPVQSVKLTFDGNGEEVRGNLAVQLNAGSIESKISVHPQQKTYMLQLTSSGIHLDKLEALKTRNIDATGVLAINASGQGSFDNPQVYATLQIPKLLVQNQTVEDLNLRMNVADHLANAELSSSAINTSIQARAQVHLTGDYLADATFDTRSIPLQPLLAMYAPGQASDVAGETEVHATLHGPLKNQTQLEAHVTIPTLKLAYGKSIELAAAAPIHVDYKNGVVDLQRTAIKGTETDLQLEGSVPVIGNAPMSVLLQGTVNLKLAQLFNPDVRAGGQIKFNINSKGATNGPNFGGEIDIVNASFSSGDLPVGLQRGNGVLTLTKDRLNISKFQGTVGGGTLTAQGGITYRPNIRFDLGLTAQGVRALYPQGVRESVDANMRLTGSTDSAVLGGSVNLTDVSFTSGFDLSSFIGQFSSGVAAPPSQGFAQNLQLNLAVRSSSDLNLVSRTLSIGGSANLQVRGTAADPVILGRVNVSNGDIILNGDRFIVNGGTVEFVNPSETQPVVNLSINTNIQQYDVFLRFNGPIDQLHTEYSSDPSLPTADIINLLAFGQTTEASAQASSTTSTTQQAQSIVASQVSSQVTSRISKVAGISQLSINPVLGNASNSNSLGASITIQQRVTGNLFVTFTSNVGSTTNQTIQGQYQVSPKLALSATRDQNGGFAVDALIKKSW